MPASYLGISYNWDWGGFASHSSTIDVGAAAAGKRIVLGITIFGSATAAAIVDSEATETLVAHGSSECSTFLWVDLPASSGSVSFQINFSGSVTGYVCKWYAVTDVDSTPVDTASNTPEASTTLIPAIDVVEGGVVLFVGVGEGTLAGFDFQNADTHPSETWWGALTGYQYQDADDTIVVTRSGTNNFPTAAAISLAPVSSGGGEDELEADSIATSAPTVGAPTIGQAHALGANGIASGSPNLGEPALGVIHNLTASGIAAGAPSVGSPSIGQEHALSAESISTGAPTVGEPALAEGAHSLEAEDISTGAPSVGTPTIAQVQVLSANGVSTGQPTVGQPGIGQVHALVADGVATGSPFAGEPELTDVPVGVNPLSAESISVGVPFMEAPTLSVPSTFRATSSGTGWAPKTLSRMERERQREEAKARKKIETGVVKALEKKGVLTAGVKAPTLGFVAEEVKTIEPPAYTSQAIAIEINRLLRKAEEYAIRRQEEEDDEAVVWLLVA